MSILLELFKKNASMAVYIHNFKGHNSLDFYSIDLILFASSSEDCKEDFLLFDYYNFLNILGTIAKKSKFYGGHLGFLKSILKIQDLLPFEYFHVSFRLTFAQLNNFITKQHTDSRVFINLQIVNNANWTWLFPDYSLIFQ